MPMFLGHAPLPLTSSATGAQGFLADVYTGSQPNLLADIGFASVAGRGTSWTLTTNTPVQTGMVVGNVRRGDVTLPGTVAVFDPGHRRFTGTLGVAAVWAGVTSDTVQKSAHLGIRFTANSVANAGGVTARATLRYVLDPYFTDQLVGVGAVNPVFAKTTSNAYVPMGQPAVGPWTQTSEEPALIPWASRGIFTGLTVVAYSATPEFPVTFTARINNAASPLTITVSPAGYHVYSAAGVASISAGDLVCWQVTAASWGTGSYFYGFVQTRFQPAVITAPEPETPVSVAQAGASVTSAWYIAGMAATGASIQKLAFSENQALWAQPFFVTRSGAAIDALGILVTDSGGASANGFLGLFIARSTQGHDLLPGSCLAGGTTSLQNPGLQTVSFAPQRLPTRQLFYAVFQPQSINGSGNVRAYATDITFGTPVLGLAPNGYPNMGWKTGADYAYPANSFFPTDVATYRPPVGVGGGFIPAVAYRVCS